MRYIDLPRYRRSGVRIPKMFIVDRVTADPIGEIHLNDPGKRGINPVREALARRVLDALNTGPAQIEVQS